MRQSEVAELLAERGAPQPTSIVRFVGTNTPRGHLTVLWRPRAGRVLAQGWEGGDENVLVQFSSVPTSDRPRVEQAFRRDVIPELAEWLRRASDAPEGWRILSHKRSWTWDDGAISTSGDEPA